jgi:hypothetical protein
MDEINSAIAQIENQPLKALSPDESVHQDNRLLNLKLQMTQAAMCHKYACLEYERTICVVRRGELQDEMSMYHDSYQVAREQLTSLNPELQRELELEICSQKQFVFGEYKV